MLLGARDPKRGQEAITDILSNKAIHRDRLELIVLDTSSNDSVKEAASKFNGELHGIINNAGVRIYHNSILYSLGCVL